MRIVIFGIGAMGCLFGAKLTPHTDVTVIGHWPDQIAALRSAPLRLIYPDGHNESVTLHVAEYDAARGPFDAALILTKSSGTRTAAGCASHLLSANGLALTLQNGLGNLEIIAGNVGSERAALGVTTQGGALDGPGVLRIGGTGTTYLSAGTAGGEAIHHLAALFNQSGLPTEVVDDVSSLVWGKLAINAAINPLTALLGVRNGALLDSEHARHIMAEAAHEVAEVAAAQGIALPFDAAARAEEVARLTGPNRSSMLQDVQRGAPTEIEAICGAVMRHGETYGVPTPVNAILYRLVKAREVL